jgi:hypothetical protein
MTWTTSKNLYKRFTKKRLCGRSSVVECGREGVLSVVRCDCPDEIGRVFGGTKTIIVFITRKCM